MTRIMRCVFSGMVKSISGLLSSMWMMMQDFGLPVLMGGRLYVA
jgi:hypothetical protein